MKIKKTKISKEVEKINKVIDPINEDNDTIDYVNETLIISGGELIDKKNFSIMSLPSIKELLKDI